MAVTKGRWADVLVEGSAVAVEFEKQLRAEVAREYEADDDLVAFILSQLRELPDKQALCKEFLEVFDDGAEAMSDWCWEKLEELTSPAAADIETEAESALQLTERPKRQPITFSLEGTVPDTAPIKASERKASQLGGHKAAAEADALEAAAVAQVQPQPRESSEQHTKSIAAPAAAGNGSSSSRHRPVLAVPGAVALNRALHGLRSSKAAADRTNAEGPPRRQQAQSQQPQPEQQQQQQVHKQQASNEPPREGSSRPAAAGGRRGGAADAAAGSGPSRGVFDRVLAGVLPGGGRSGGRSSSSRHPPAGQSAPQQQQQQQEQPGSKRVSVFDRLSAAAAVNGTGTDSQQQQPSQPRGHERTQPQQRRSALARLSADGALTESMEVDGRQPASLKQNPPVAATAPTGQQAAAAAGAGGAAASAAVGSKRKAVLNDQAAAMAQVPAPADAKRSPGSTPKQVEQEPLPQQPLAKKVRPAAAAAPGSSSRKAKEMAELRAMLAAKQAELLQLKGAAGDNESDKHSVVVFGMSPRVPEPVLKAHFSVCGSIKRATLLTHKPQRGINPPSAFIEFQDGSVPAPKAVAAALGLTNSTLLDERITVTRKTDFEAARAKPFQRPQPRSDQAMQTSAPHSQTFSWKRGQAAETTGAADPQGSPQSLGSLGLDGS